MYRVLTLVQRDQQHLCSTGTQVPSPPWNKGLRIWCCLSCSIGCNCGSDLIPSLATPYASGGQKRKKKIVIKKIFLKIAYRGVPVVVQQKRIRLGTMRLQVQSLASLSGLRIQSCRELW